jgi:hypothetical protein
MADSKKKWMGMAAVGAAIAALVARMSRRGNREVPPKEADTPDDAHA